MATKLKVIQLELDDVFLDMVRVHLDHRPKTRAGDVVRISCGKRSLLAVARGSRKNKKDVIAIDLESRRKLDLKAGDEVVFNIKKVGFIGQFCWAWNATDAMPRIGARLGLLSLFLGILGGILGVLSIWPSICPSDEIGAHNAVFGLEITLNVPRPSFAPLAPQL